ncbi:hypothetical protein ACLKA7_012524 [Drosophila subpalustris]
MEMSTCKQQLKSVMRAVNEKGIDIDDIPSTSGAAQGGMHGSCAPMGGTQGFGAASAHAERAALKMNTGPVLANGAPGHGGTDVPLTEMKTTDAGRGVNTVQENLLRLQKSLKGEAKDEVAGMLINPANVEHIMGRLEFKYGQTELLIRSQLEKISEIPQIFENSLDKIVPFSSKVANLIIFLETANAAQHLNNPVLLSDLVNKLPIRIRIDWSRYAACIRPYPNIKNFGDWINHMAMDVSRATLATASSKQHGKGDQRSNQKTLMQTSTDAPHKMEQNGCFKCKGNHILEKCESFSKETIEDRWTLVKKAYLCYGCLRQGHSLKSCKKKQECGISDCKSYHHHLLHKNKTNSSNVEQKETPKHQATETVNTIKAGTSKLLFKVLPVEVTGPNGFIVETFAFVDEGSSATLINENLAKNMGINQPKEKLSLNWIGSYTKDVQSMRCQFRIRSAGSSKRWLRLMGNTVPNMNLPLQSLNADSLTAQFERMKQLPIMGYEKAEPMLLIGIDNVHLTKTFKSTCLGEDLVAAKTPLGWLYKQFVAHRISEILDTTNENDWRWVPTQLNPADKATKTIKNLNYEPQTIWTKGPNFLMETESLWPSQEKLIAPINDSTEKRKIILHASSDLLFDIGRFSRYVRLKRTVGWMLRFVERTRHPEKITATGELTFAELRQAELILCKLYMEDSIMPLFCLKELVNLSYCQRDMILPI